MSRRTVSFLTDYGEASAEIWTCDNKACHNQATVQQAVFWLGASNPHPTMGEGYRQDYCCRACLVADQTERAERERA